MNRVAISSLIVLFAGVAAVRSAPPLDPANPPEGTFADDWYTVEMDRARAGHVHSTITRDGQHITTRTDMTLTLRRGDDQVSIVMRQTYRELLDGTPVGFDDTLEAGNVPIRSVGRIREGKIKLTNEQFGKRESRELPFDMSARLPWGAYLEQRRRGFEPGTAYSLKGYESSLRPDGPLITRFEVIGPDEIELSGATVRAIKVRETLLLGPSANQAGTQPASSQPAGMIGLAAAGVLQRELPSTAWVDGEGRVLRMDTRIGGLFDIRMSRTTKQAALATVGKSAELFARTLIPVAQSLDPDAVEIVYRISTQDGSPLADLPGTAMQRFKRTGAGRGALTVRRIDWKSLRSRRIKPAGITQDAYLKPSLVADAADPQIRKLTQEAIGAEKEPSRRADRLRRFVSRYIIKKDMNVGFATASEVARGRQGDCTEHAVLLAAMCRAAGLPARGVAGIVKVPESGPVRFGYHMWTQVWIDGKWIDIDAALLQTECDSTHIVLTILDLDDSGIVDASWKLLEVLGRLKLEVAAAGDP